MRIIPKPPDAHKLLNPVMRAKADAMWDAIHILAYTLVGAVVAFAFTVVVLALR